MSNRPDHVERGGEVRADTPDKWSDDDTARQEHGLPDNSAPDNGNSGRLEGTDTPSTTDAEIIEREKGKRTTM